MTTFVWIPSYGSAVTTTPAVAVAKFGDGYEQRVGLGLNNRPRKWEVAFNNRPDATADAIDAFLAERNAEKYFDWTPPRGAAGRWVCREWVATPTGPNSQSISATFEEVFG